MRHSSGKERFACTWRPIEQNALAGPQPIEHGLPPNSFAAEVKLIYPLRNPKTYYLGLGYTQSFKKLWMLDGQLNHLQHNVP